MKIIDNAGYKDLSGIRRIPIARVVGKGGVESVVIGNDAIDQAGALPVFISGFLTGPLPVLNAGL